MKSCHKSTINYIIINFLYIILNDRYILKTQIIKNNYLNKYIEIYIIFLFFNYIIWKYIFSVNIIDV